MKLQIGLDDVTLSSYCDDPLVRAVVISLFSWRLADPDDDVQAGDRQGWWGDTFADTPGDLTGSRLWELMRKKITPETISQAVEFAEEALAWLVEDAVAASVDVSAEVAEGGRVDMAVTIKKPTAEQISIRFQNVWGVR